MSALDFIPANFAFLGASRIAANDSYGEVTVGGIKTACISREGLAQLMLADCLDARQAGLLAQLCDATLLVTRKDLLGKTALSRTVAVLTGAQAAPLAIIATK